MININIITFTPDTNMLGVFSSTSSSSPSSPSPSSRHHHHHHHYHNTSDHHDPVSSSSSLSLSTIDISNKSGSISSSRSSRSSGSENIIINEAANNNNKQCQTSLPPPGGINATTTGIDLRTCGPLVSTPVLLFALLSSILAPMIDCKPPFHYSQMAEHRMIMQDRAILHVNLMNTNGLCRDPRPIVVYPPSSHAKQYYPRGTLLHRCTDQTGCCPNPGEVCRPNTLEQVEKVFFVNHIVLGGQKFTGQRLKVPPRNFTTVTESLTFTNHTSCKCIKLAPDVIEHDELQSVISRPLVTPINAINSNSFIYYMIGSITVVAFCIVLFVMYKWFYFTNHHHVHHQHVPH